MDLNASEHIDAAIGPDRRVKNMTRRIPKVATLRIRRIEIDRERNRCGVDRRRALERAQQRQRQEQC